MLANGSHSGKKFRAEERPPFPQFIAKTALEIGQLSSRKTESAVFFVLKCFCLFFFVENVTDGGSINQTVRTLN